MGIKLSDKEIELLEEVGKAKEFYPPLAENEKSILLRRLKRRGLIGWSPYPEEFYFILPAGKSLIEEKVNG